MIDDPLDTPPEWVIKAETCEAAYSGYYYIGGEGGFTGSCDNGLGFEAEETIEPIYFWDPIYGPILIGYAFAGTVQRSRPIWSGRRGLLCSVDHRRPASVAEATGGDTGVCSFR